MFIKTFNNDCGVFGDDTTTKIYKTPTDKENMFSITNI